MPRRPRARRRPTRAWRASRTPASRTGTTARVRASDAAREVGARPRREAHASLDARAGMPSAEKWRDRVGGGSGRESAAGGCRPSTSLSYSRDECRPADRRADDGRITLARLNSSSDAPRGEGVALRFSRAAARAPPAASPAPVATMPAPTSARPSFASSTRAVVGVLRPRATPVPRFARRRTRRHATPPPSPRVARAPTPPSTRPRPPRGGEHGRRAAAAVGALPHGRFRALPPSASRPRPSPARRRRRHHPRRPRGTLARAPPSHHLPPRGATPTRSAPTTPPSSDGTSAPLVFRNILEVLTAQSLLVALGMGSTPGALPLTAATKWVPKTASGPCHPLRGIPLRTTLRRGSQTMVGLHQPPRGRRARVGVGHPRRPRAVPPAGGVGDVRALRRAHRPRLAHERHLHATPRPKPKFGRRSRQVGGAGAVVRARGAPRGHLHLPRRRRFVRRRGVDGAARYSAAVAAYGSVVAGHAVCCWKAASVLRFDTLNRARLLNAARHFLREGAEGLPTTEAAGAAEGVYRARTPPGTPTLGASLPDAARDWTHLETLLALGRAEAATRAGVDAGVGSSPNPNPNPKRDSPRSMAASRRRFVLGWDARRDAPAALLDASATPDDVIAAALAAVHAADAADARRTSRNGGGGGTVGVTLSGVANGSGVTSGRWTRRRRRRRTRTRIDARRNFPRRCERRGGERISCRWARRRSTGWTRW